MLRGYKPRVAHAKRGVQNVKSDNRCENNCNDLSKSE